MMAFKRRKAETLTFSAEFKRDYIALTAMGAFFLILFFEVALAICIPAYLQRENTMAREVARYRMAAALDGLRYRIEAVSKREKDELALAELRLIQWDANLWAGYLRREKQYLSDAEIADLTSRFQQMATFVNRIATKKTVSREYRLDTSRYVNSLLNKEK
ncbi:MAG: hypothetical protein MJ016_00015 [Victivallaceae bacterium]|nr:hypothetical protein [Victivallaceae bacterium]